MVEVRLHGDLAKSFGMVWNLDIATPREAAAAIEANRPGFAAKVMELARKGLVFRVRSRAHDYAEDDIDTRLGGVKRIDIIPIVEGASAGVRFIVGAALVAIGYFFPSPISPFLINAGVALMIGSVVEWLTPKPQKKDFKDSLESWTFNGPVNSTDQGQPVPVIYGEVLAGSYPISAGLIAAQLSPAGSIEADVSFGGELNVPGGISNDAASTGVTKVTALAFNISDPMTYSWTYSGFAGAAAVRVTGLNKATVDVAVDFAPGIPESSTVSVTGTLTVTVVGVQPSTHQQVTVTKSVSITFSMTRYYVDTSTGA